MIRALIRLGFRLVAPAIKFHKWLVEQETADNARRMNRAFPPGTRIVVTSGCPCGMRFVGRHGAVRGLSNFGGEEPDYQVDVDGNIYDDPAYPTLLGKQRYELICAKALEKEPTS